MRVYLYTSMSMWWCIPPIPCAMPKSQEFPSSLGLYVRSRR